MKELIPYTKPNEIEQAFINNISRKYHIKGNDNSSKCVLNQLNWSDSESDLHLKRKLTLALNSQYFLSEASRSNVVMDYGKRFPYRNPNGNEVIRDLITILPCYSIFECESCIGHGSSETYKRFLNSSPWIKNDGKYGLSNIENIRDPDWNSILVNIFQNNLWGIYFIKHKPLFILNDNSIIEYFNKLYNTNFNIIKGNNIELLDDKIKLIINVDYKKEKVYVSNFNIFTLNRNSLINVFNLINNDGIFEVHKSHRKFYEEYNLEFKPIKQICNYSGVHIHIDKLEFYAGKRIVDEDIKFDNSRIADLGQELIDEYNKIK